jgi:hypothetical protein
MRDRMRILRHDGIQTVRSYLGFVHDRKDAFSACNVVRSVHWDSWR